MLVKNYVMKYNKSTKDAGRKNRWEKDDGGEAYYPVGRALYE